MGCCCSTSDDSVEEWKEPLLKTTVPTPPPAAHTNDRAYGRLSTESSGEDPIGSWPTTIYGTNDTGAENAQGTVRDSGPNGIEEEEKEEDQAVRRGRRESAVTSGLAPPPPPPPPPQLSVATGDSPPPPHPTRLQTLCPPKTPLQPSVINTPKTLVFLTTTT